MSEEYQVLTYRVQRNEGRQKLQRVVIDADAHRVDLRGELRLTQEVVAVDPQEMKEYKVTLSPASLDTETLPVVVGVLPESHFCLDAQPDAQTAVGSPQLPSPFSSPSASWTLGFCSRPTKVLELHEELQEDQALEFMHEGVAEETEYMVDAPISHEDLLAAAQALREETLSSTSSYDGLAQVEDDGDAEARHEARLAMLEWSDAQPLGTAHVERPSWEELNLRDEAPPRPHRDQQTITSALLLLAAICASALMWALYITQ